MPDAAHAPILIVGSGMAGAQTAMVLRQKGYEGPVTLIGEELHPPYQRPPLSKAYLKGGEDAGDDSVLLRPEEFWAEKDVEIVAGTRVASIDRAARTVSLEDGRELPYEHLVLATGSRNRPLPGEHADLDGVLHLRTLDEARALREALEAPGARVVIVGGGFIGLEVAAAARERGADVVVVEALERVMARVVSPPMSQFFAAEHTRQGVRMLTGRRVAALEGEGRVSAVVLEDGERLEADVVIVGVGVDPDTALAQAAGLEVDDGIVVDEHLQTSDPAISAVGDCTRFPCAITGRRHRLESVQNATDQARTVATRLAGEPGAHVATPWFWTEQYGRRLQIAGVAGPGATEVLRGSPADDRFSVCRFEDGRLVSVESVDFMADHMAARKLLASGAATGITPEQVADPEVPLKSLL